MKLNSDIPRGSIPAADAFVVVDTCAWQQLGAMSEIIRNSTAPRIVIDHHVSSDQLDAHEFKDVTAAATGELIFELAASLDYHSTAPQPTGCMPPLPLIQAGSDSLPPRPAP
ncbi:MAG UNVERIFIED_CONTAM: hypothetical protein LVR18_46390 [Planctomycetaceae bacterium]